MNAAVLIGAIVAGFVVAKLVQKWHPGEKQKEASAALRMLAVVAALVLVVAIGALWFLMKMVTTLP